MRSVQQTAKAKSEMMRDSVDKAGELYVAVRWHSMHVWQSGGVVKVILGLCRIEVSSLIYHFLAALADLLEGDLR